MKNPLQTVEEIIVDFEAGNFVKWHSWVWIEHMKVLIKHIKKGQMELFN